MSRFFCFVKQACCQAFLASCSFTRQGISLGFFICQTKSVSKSVPKWADGSLPESSLANRCQGMCGRGPLHLCKARTLSSTPYRSTLSCRAIYSCSAFLLLSFSFRDLILSIPAFVLCSPFATASTTPAKAQAANRFTVWSAVQGRLSYRGWCPLNRIGNTLFTS